MITETVFNVIDTETTGLDPAIDRIVEVGWCQVQFDPELQRFDVSQPRSRFCNPGFPIPPEARAVHHISDDMVRGHPSADVALPQLMIELAGTSMQNNSCFVAHNADFDRGFALRAGALAEWLCTMRLAKHFWTTAPAFNNQTLRYWQGLELSEHQHYLAGFAVDQPHRAAHDAYVTAHLLCRLLPHALAANPSTTIAQLIDFSRMPVVLRGKVGFGKHHDKTWQQVPRDYLDWILKQDRDDWEDDVWATAAHYAGRRDLFDATRVTL